jgi:hypothetical protein
MPQVRLSRFDGAAPWGAVVTRQSTFPNPVVDLDQTGKAAQALNAKSA